MSEEKAYPENVVPKSMAATSVLFGRSHTGGGSQIGVTGSIDESDRKLPRPTSRGVMDREKSCSFGFSEGVEESVCL